MANDDRTPRPDDRPPVRIGDAERQRMTDLLQQHMAAGRLDMAEYERRVEHATSAVFERDLDGLLDDLPALDEDGEPRSSGGPAPRPRVRDDRESWGWSPRQAGRGWPPWPRGIPSPLLVVGGVLLVVLTHGWILLPLLFLAVSRGGGWCGPRHPGRHRQHERWDDWSTSSEHGTTGRAPDPDDRADTPRWPGRFDPFGDDRRM